jgi:hypothetical protein
VDFRSHAFGRDFEGRKRDRQLEAPRASAAGIEVQDAIYLLNLRSMEATGDDHVDISARIDVQRCF